MKQLSFLEEKPQIPGLTYIPKYISTEQEAELLSIIDQNSWITDLKRRTQHYGYKYDYKSRNINSSHYIGPIPEWIAPICKKLFQDGIFEKTPDQVIINEYLPGQGIAPHIDSTSCFGNTICSLSLGSSCVMDLYKGTNKMPILLEPCSLVVLKNNARRLWQHGIAPRKTDRYLSTKITRGRRISLTFRWLVQKMS